MVRPSTESLKDQSLEIINQELSSQDLEGYMLEERWGGDSNQVITEELNFIPKLVEIEKLLLKVENGDFELDYKKDLKPIFNRQEVSCTLSSDLKKAISLFSFKHTLLPYEFDDYKYIRAQVNPRLRLGILILKRVINASNLERGNVDLYNDSNFLDAFIEGFKTYLHLLYKNEEAAKRKHWKLLQRRHKSSMIGYIDQLLNKWHSLYLIHLDLGVKSISAVTANDNYEELNSSLKVLLRNKQRNPIWQNDLVGHICKLEWNSIHKLHARLFIFYKGDAADRHQNDADKIIQQWFEITKDKGVVLSRIKRENKVLLIPEKEGVLISNDKPESIEELYRYLNYLVDLDHIFGIKGNGIKVFSRGKTDSKLGG